MRNLKFILIFMIVFFPKTNWAANYWTDLGNYDTSWYDDINTSFDISTPQELAGLAYLCNNGNSFTGKTINLQANIDLSINEWTPIDTFSGTFNGNFHYINESTLKMSKAYCRHE